MLLTPYEQETKKLTNLSNQDCLVYDQYFALRNFFVFKLNSAPRAHDRKVAIIQKQVHFFLFINIVNRIRNHFSVD